MKTLGSDLSGALFSDDLKYRYQLWRKWEPNGLTFGCCMLNPSTADHEKLDPTIKQVIKRARALGFGKLVVVNLFAFRATKPKKLLEVDDPVGGPANNESIIEVATISDLMLLGWGTYGETMDRGLRVLHLLKARGFDKKCRYLKLTQRGQPGHPLYIPDDETLKEF